MKKIFVSDLREDEVVHATFLVTRHELRDSRTGDPYLRLVLSDRSGDVEARAWREPELLSGRIAVDDFVAVRAVVKRTDQKHVLELDDLERVDESSIEPADFFPVSRWPAEQLFDALLKLLDDEVRSPAIRAFLHALFADEERKSRFITAPAAMSNHHAFRGGLVEHCLSMAQIAAQLGAHYRHYYPGLINSDLLLAGVVLHDFAKIWELSYARAFDYTTVGRLVGHIPMGAQLVLDVAREADADIPDDLTMHLQHLVLSHHGKPEFGAAAHPMTVEAILLHQIDMIDSRVNMLWNERAACMVDGAAEAWSDYRRSLGGRLLFRGENSAGWEVPDDPAADVAPAVEAEPPSSASTLNLFEDDE